MIFVASLIPLGGLIVYDFIGPWPIKLIAWVVTALLIVYNTPFSPINLGLWDTLLNNERSKKKKSDDSLHVKSNMLNFIDLNVGPDYYFYFKAANTIILV